ncbi:hypothetical protein LCGC14_1286960 [marine sediment metagenome]|uniref:Tip attachment protein J domain-containing protein n=1 Tax=marine sediment metagenome TaxID=412755 RepID=A0A0F9LEG7_9ZZZZ
MPPLIPIIVGIAIAAPAIGAVVAGAAIAGLAGSLILLGSSLILSGVSRALIKPPEFGDFETKAQSRLVSARQSAAPRVLIYGLVRLGGIVTFLDKRGTNGEFLDVVLTISGHEVEEIGTMYFDGVSVPLDASGVGSAANATGKFAGHVRVQKNLGADSQAALSDLVTASFKWTTNHRQRGCAHVWIELKLNPDLFPNGTPQITFDVKGAKVFDTRTSTTAYSANAALCLRDYLVKTRLKGGAGIAAALIPDSFVDAAANLADEDVTLDLGGTEDRYTCNGTISTAEQPGQIIQQFLSAMAGKLVFSGGEWQMYGGAWRAPTVSFDETELVGPLKVESRLPRRELFNAVKGVIVTAANNWQPSDFPPVTNTTYETEDGERLWKDVDFPFTTSAATAQRLAKIDLETARQQKTVRVRMNLKALQVNPPDVIQLTVARFSWTNKNFEIAEQQLVWDDSGDAPALMVEMLLRETASTVYDWTAASDEDQPTAPGSPDLPDSASLDDISDGLTYHFREEVFVEYFEQDVHTAWNLRAGGAAVTYPSDGQAGGRVLQAAGNGDWRAYPENIPFDPSKLYRIRCRVRQTANPADPAKDLFYCGVEGVAADGVTAVNRTGAASWGTQHWICAQGEDGGAWGLNTWVEYTGYFKGWAGTGSNKSPDPANPGALHTNVRYFRPLFIMNQPSDGDGTQQLDYIAVDVLPDDYGSNFELMPSIAVGDWTNPANAFDGDEDSYAQGIAGSFELLGYAPILTGPYNIGVKMISSAPTVPSGATVYGEYSKDSGQNWVQIYARTGVFAKTTDEVTLGSPPTKTSKMKARQRLVGGSTTSATKNGGTLANENYAGGSVNWTAPANAQTSNDSYATASLGAEIISNYLKVTNCLFAATGAIQGIRVRVERKASVATMIDDAVVRLVKGGVVVGQDKGGGFWPITDAYASYGGSSDLWGESWAIGDINASDFGVVIAARNADISARLASIDHIEITVWYGGNMPTGRLHEATIVLSLK